MIRYKRKASVPKKGIIGVMQIMELYITCSQIYSTMEAIVRKKPTIFRLEEELVAKLKELAKLEH